MAIKLFLDLICLLTAQWIADIYQETKREYEKDKKCRMKSKEV